MFTLSVKQRRNKVKRSNCIQFLKSIVACKNTLTILLEIINYRVFYTLHLAFVSNYLNIIIVISIVVIIFLCEIKIYFTTKYNKTHF